MTPEELASRHPRLFHLTLPSNLPGIERHGLLPATALLTLHGGPAGLERIRRPAAVPLPHPVYGTATLNDQSPMTEAALARCLDDGLVPGDWLATLNRRVFFWADAAGLNRLLHARANRGRAVRVLEVDTLALAQAYAEQIELSAINSGATIRRPARRGLTTFTPMLRHSYADWRRLRGGLDKVLEVTVVGGVPDAARFISLVRVHRINEVLA